MAGAVIEPRALEELFPEWRKMNTPLRTEVTKDSLKFLTSSFSISMPIIKSQNNHGNYIISLGEFSKWLANQAEELGVEIYPGFPGTEILYHQDGSVKGVATGDQGIGKDGEPTSTFQRGMELHSPLTLFAEGTRGSLTKKIIEKYELRNGVEPQTYGLGLKEVWEVDPSKFQKGLVEHTMGYPMDSNTWGGSFAYHWEDNKVNVGYVVALDYKNPYLSPYQEFQRWKQHPSIRNLFEGGKCISYGARSLSEGGYQSLPKLIFPGGALVGDSAGFLNTPKIKGIHTAIKSAILAADAAFDTIIEKKTDSILLDQYPKTFEKSWLYDELYQIRNIRPSFHFGMFTGMIYTGIDWIFLNGKEPWTFKHGKPDHLKTGKASDYKPINYPKPDGIITFDLLTNLARSGTNHNENQPSHLKILNKQIPIEVNYKEYAALESRYCPAGVYEYPNDSHGKPYLQVNSQNCLHCKTCDIKDPSQNINWETPEGGGGPSYSNM